MLPNKKYRIAFFCKTKYNMKRKQIYIYKKANSAQKALSYPAVCPMRCHCGIMGGLNALKRKITYRLCMIVTAFMLLVLFLNYVLQMEQAKKDAYASAQDLFWQIEKVLNENEQELIKEQKEYAASCLEDAQTAAYIIALNKEVMDDVPELNKIAGLLEVDEIHFFDSDGNLYGGNIPMYWGMSMDSGEQISFFRPMLQNKSLSLIQGIVPNTAEQKSMQYAAVWQEDGEGIVQIGKTPQRVLEAMKRNELSYAFSLVAANSEATICAIDPTTYKILRTTNEDYANQMCGDIGISLKDLQVEGKGTVLSFRGQPSFAVFKRTESVVLCNIISLGELYRDINNNTGWLALYMVMISGLMIIIILAFLDKFIIREISSISEKMAIISKGDLDARITVNSTPELMRLGDQINDMVESLINNMGKISSVLDVTSIPIGVYEYHPTMKSVMATRRVGEILGLSSEETKAVLADHTLLEAKLNVLRQNPWNKKKGIYQLQDADRFIRMDTIACEPNIVGVLLDVTNDVMEMRVIEHERDMDILTNLYNRRAFYRQTDEIFQQQETLGHGLVLIADADFLKQVNDKHGHENGDRYLRGIAEVLRSCKAKKKIVARMGGDEFALVVYGCDSEETVQGYVQAIYKAMDEYTVILSNDLAVPIHFSLGYAMFPREGRDHLALAKIADTRMYAQKNAL